MAFNNKWICKYDENMSFKEVIESLENNDYFVENTNFNTLKHKIDILDYYNSDSLNFVYGKYGYQYETKATSAIITPEKIIDKGDLTVKTNVISFWIADNHKIIFSLKDEKSKNKFAENIFDRESSILPCEIDIKKMQEASRKGELSKMWATSFEDRENNINKGNLYGSDVMADPMFSETVEATQKFVGIIIDPEDKKIKIRLFKDGGMQIYSKTLSPTDPFVFNLIEDLEKFIE